MKLPFRVPEQKNKAAVRPKALQFPYRLQTIEVDILETDSLYRKTEIEQIGDQQLEKRNGFSQIERARVRQIMPVPGEAFMNRQKIIVMLAPGFFHARQECQEFCQHAMGFAEDADFIGTFPLISFPLISFPLVQLLELAMGALYAAADLPDVFR